MMRLFIVIVFAFFSNLFLAQDKPVLWSYESIQSKEDQREYTIIFHAVVEDGYHLYAHELPSKEDGPLPTDITYVELNNVSLEGELEGGTYITEMDETFQVEVNYYENEANFTQKVILQDREKEATITGIIYYMVCNDRSCIPFEQQFRVLVQLHK